MSKGFLLGLCVLVALVVGIVAILFWSVEEPNTTAIENAGPEVAQVNVILDRVNADRRAVE